MTKRLAADVSLPGGVRLRLWLPLGYLVMPLDLVPDFLPVVGYADDALIVAAAVRYSCPLAQTQNSLPSGSAIASSQGVGTNVAAGTPIDRAAYATGRNSR